MVMITMVMMMTMMRLSSHWPLSPDSRPSLASEWERASDLIVVIIQQLHQSTIIDIIIHVKNLKPKMRTPVHNVERGKRVHLRPVSRMWPQNPQDMFIIIIII